MKFVTIPGKAYELGWRFTSSLPDTVLKTLASFVTIDELTTCFSPHRRVAIDEFEIATDTMPFEDLLGDPYELAGVATIEELCARVDERLAAEGFRLPTEDELEAAAGGALFPWGMTVPDGIPYRSETSFVRHKQPNCFELNLNWDPYRVEICRYALKFGDGGGAICGGDPWPMAWLTLSPSFRLLDDDVAECFPETLETAHIRPVRRG